MAIEILLTSITVIVSILFVLIMFKDAHISRWLARLTFYVLSWSFATALVSSLLVIWQ